MTAEQLAIAFEDAIRVNGLTLEEAFKVLKRHVMIRTLERCCNNQQWAADELGWHRNTFARVAEEVGIDLKNYRMNHTRKMRPKSVGEIPQQLKGRSA